MCQLLSNRCRRSFMHHKCFVKTGTGYCFCKICDCCPPHGILKALWCSKQWRHRHIQETRELIPALVPDNSAPCQAPASCCHVFGPQWKRADIFVLYHSHDRNWTVCLLYVWRDALCVVFAEFPSPHCLSHSSEPGQCLPWISETGKHYLQSSLILKYICGASRSFPAYILSVQAPSCHFVTFIFIHIFILTGRWMERGSVSDRFSEQGIKDHYWD